MPGSTELNYGGLTLPVSAHAPHIRHSAKVENFLSFQDQRASSSGSGSGQTTTSGTSSAASTAAIGMSERLGGLLGTWSRQAPSKTLDPVTSWGAVIAHRHDCFKAIEVHDHISGALDLRKW